MKTELSDMRYYHVAINLNGKRVATWADWATSQEDAEGKAENYANRNNIAFDKCVAEGHE